MRPTAARPFINALVNRPNLVRDKQIALQNDPAPTYLKGRGKYYYRGFLVMLACSLGWSQFTLIQYVRGKAKKHGE
ncbi:hypothetical protein BCR39DRAFT_539595 [Naematelia encephala]|uniref:Uncharacterized protein n=1 Tax=Naematelia encephala TaxID=71784 RepID=A0A1Y2AWU6_9TREE|nr:hypothetical protein BCR39DRAFT_539595 [Naematelia encephala]